jgi:hypothetical protein
MPISAAYVICDEHSRGRPAGATRAKIGEDGLSCRYLAVVTTHPGFTATLTKSNAVRMGPGVACTRREAEHQQARAVIEHDSDRAAVNHETSGTYLARRWSAPPTSVHDLNSILQLYEI